MFVVERFAAWAEDYRKVPIAPEVLHHAKRAVIDLYAALLPGAVVAPATLLESALKEELDRGKAMLALGRSATVRAAALINGTAAHTVEVDDIFRDGIYHPGAPTIPAALAMAQAHDASGERFLRAVIVGYEIATRIGAAMGRAHYKYWHNTGTIGVFGACAAARPACSGLDIESMRKDCCRPAENVVTVASACAKRFASRPSSSAAAAQAPKQPMVPVLCQYR